MGTILESNPILKGSSISLNYLEHNYFSKVNSILRNNYETNLYSDTNLEISLQKKSFEQSQIIQGKLEDVSWLDYIYNHLNYLKKKKENTWAMELEEELMNQSFFYVNEYLSDFFYNEYNIKSFPNTLNDEDDDDYNLDYNNMSNNSIIKNNNTNDNKSFNELDVTNNYGGSYMDLKVDNLMPNDPTIRYILDRKLMKKYLKIFKKHIYNDKDHPIHKTILLFNKIFCKYIKNKIKLYKDNFKNKKLTEEEFNKVIKQLEINTTKNLQEFIIMMNCSLKLFYSTCINYAFFKEEKDDLINLVISLFFKIGKLYETIFELYSLSYSKDIQSLEEKLQDLQYINPKSLEISEKYCLDEDTLDLQNNIIKEKQKEKQENKNKEDKKPSQNNTLTEIKENDEDIKDNEDNNNNKDEIVINTKDNNRNNTYDKTNLVISCNNMILNEEEINNNINNEDEDDDYLLSKLKEEDISSIDPKTDPEGEANYIRKTISNFNSKKYLFPQIRNKIRDTLAQNEQYIQEAKLSGKLPMPYFSAINLMKKIRSFKTPFEKIIILAAINDQITESVMSFWNKMIKYIKSSYLFIEADELKSIFLYIFIKAQMPEIYVECKIINNFTTQQTKGFNISYNLVMTEASIEKIMGMQNTREANKVKEELKEVRKTIYALANQRFSRLSRMSSNENPFS